MVVVYAIRITMFMSFVLAFLCLISPAMFKLFGGRDADSWRELAADAPLALQWWYFKRWRRPVYWVFGVSVALSVLTLPFGD